MKPPPDLPLELVLLAEAFARRLEMPAPDFWAVVYRKKEPPPGWAAAWADAFEPLTSSIDNDTKDTMDATPIAPARRGRPSTRTKHPFVAALIKKRVTVADVAAKVHRSHSTVKAWYKDPSDSWFRPIPKACAVTLREWLGVPLSAWARIAD